MARLFTATPGGITAGIAVKDGCIALGETGRARTLVKVGVSAPIGADGKIHRGAVVRDRNVRIEPEAPGAPDAIVVRVRTDWTYTRGCPGRLALGRGLVEIAKGFTAWGDAGGLGSHPDVLLGAKGPGAALVTFSGGRGKGLGLRLLAVVETADGLMPELYDLPAVGDAALRPELDPIAGLAGHLPTVLDALDAVQDSDAKERLAGLRAKFESRTVTEF